MVLNSNQELEQLSDEALLKAYKKGNEDAFMIIFKRYEKNLIAYLAKYSSNIELSRDICQDSFLKLIQKPPSFLLGGKLKPWLFRTARNGIIDHLRRSNRQVDNPLAIEQLKDDERPDKALRNEEDIKMLSKYIDDLPDDIRDVVCQRVYGNLSFKEISKVSSMPLGTALWRMQKGIKMMRKAMLKDKQF